MKWLFGSKRGSGDKTRKDFKNRNPQVCEICGGSRKKEPMTLRAQGPHDVALHPVCGKCYMRKTYGVRPDGKGNWKPVTSRGNVLHEKRLKGEFGKGKK